MKLTHRDFRPLRRSKYVAQPLKRRPTLRILLLAVIGVTVYLKYDSVVNSKAFRNLRQPRRILDAMLHQDIPPVEASAPGEGLRWSRDSSEVELACPGARIEACLDRSNSLGREAVGALRADVEKAQVQWQADATKGVKARFVRVPDAADPLTIGASRLELARLEILGTNGSVVLESRPGENGATLCERNRCLDAFQPQPPFARYRETDKTAAEVPGRRWIPEAGFTSLEGPAAKPILRGRVVEAPANLGPDQWVKIYHGENTFSWYRGFSSLRTGLKPGDLIETQDTLGFVASQGDSAGTLEVRIEKNGLLVDPRGFLGAASKSTVIAGTGDGR